MSKRYAWPGSGLSSRSDVTLPHHEVRDGPRYVSRRNSASAVAARISRWSSCLEELAEAADTRLEAAIEKHEKATRALANKMVGIIHLMEKEFHHADTHRDQHLMADIRALVLSKGTKAKSFVVKAADSGDRAMIHTVLKDFISKAPPWTPFTDEHGTKWVVCTSNFRQNPHIDQDAYKAQLLASTGGDKALTEAWLDGTWAALGGGMFADVFKPEVHSEDYVPEDEPPGAQSKKRAFDRDDPKTWTFYSYLKRASETFGPEGAPILPQARNFSKIMKERVATAMVRAVVRRDNAKDKEAEASAIGASS